MANGSAGGGNNKLFGNKHVQVGIILLTVAAIAVALSQITGVLNIVYMPKDQLRKEFISRVEFDRVCVELRTAMRENHDETIHRIERMEDKVLTAVRNGGGGGG